MNFFRRFVPKRAVACLDTDASGVRVVIADKQPDGRFEFLGRGRADASGFESAEIVNLGDAVESVIRALDAAQEEAGFRVEKLYYNFDDPSLISQHPRSSRVLKGDGEIRVPDIEDARRVAERFTDHFDRSIVYSRPVRFLIDDRDPVADPLGVFGRKLDVWTHILQARAAHCQLWQRLIERAGLRRGVRVLSAISSAYGVLPAEARRARHLIADAGRDLANIFVWQNGAVADQRVARITGGAGQLASEVRALAERHPDLDRIVLCGDLASEAGFAQAVSDAAGLAVDTASPAGIAGLDRPADAAFAGLLRVAEELENKARMIPKDTNMVDSARSKVQEFIHEYF